ncbi:MAG TPA: 5'-3' exonuclease H3TH domain-containing protein [Steroidobacteraceae bacterium]|nr:5'-3' exonuclease H3TH domain-containing protein [Steroidobacteraceae bacterium]
MIYLVDASVYVFRAYYSALPEFLDQEGQPAHAVYGFARFLGDLIERARPTYMAVAFDQSLTGSFRNRIYPAYKANREPAPPGLALQFERCFEFCTLAGIAALGSPEYEADDIIGSIAARMRAANVRSTLVSRDKDLAQLVREGDVFWDYAARDPLSYSDVKRHYGVAPERFADYLALTGDAVDNIPGIPGIGPKTAAGLMQEFASLDELYGGLDRVSGLKVRGAARLRALLLEHREAAYLARQLTGIVCDMPLAIETSALRRQRPDLEGLRRFFDRQTFGPLLRRQAERLAQLPTPS